MPLSAARVTRSGWHRCAPQRARPPPTASRTPAPAPGAMSQEACSRQPWISAPSPRARLLRVMPRIERPLVAMKPRFAADEPALPLPAAQAGVRVEASTELHCPHVSGPPDRRGARRDPWPIGLHCADHPRRLWSLLSRDAGAAGPPASPRGDGAQDRTGCVASAQTSRSLHSGVDRHLYAPAASTGTEASHPPCAYIGLSLPPVVASQLAGVV